MTASFVLVALAALFLRPEGSLADGHGARLERRIELGAVGFEVGRVARRQGAVAVEDESKRLLVALWRPDLPRRVRMEREGPIEETLDDHGDAVVRVVLVLDGLREVVVVDRCPVERLVVVG